MHFERSSGVLLHITSLPGKYGIGDLGPSAFEFADTLFEAGVSFWQILPTGPVDPGMGYSPYASSSTFAGNWMMISPEEIAKRTWYEGSIDIPLSEEGHFVDFDRLNRLKKKFLDKAADDFFANASQNDKNEFEKFCEDEFFWLDDFSLFTALAGMYGTNDWKTWDKGYSVRDPGLIEKFRNENSGDLARIKFIQFIFFSQWRVFKDYCEEKNIKLIGDIPIYVTLSGADAWANPGILQVDPGTHEPLFIAGVPPDYFSETGQLWGNPLYQWFEEDGSLNTRVLEWWRNRISTLLKLVDIIRIDHFRGFESYWAVPADEDTALNGEWVEGPGMKFFDYMKSQLGDLPLIAEDLGVITPEVEKLRDDLALPGMKILQFAFDMNSDNYYLPHNIKNPNCVLYTGTHDNNTTNGWFYEGEVFPEMKEYIKEYMGFEDERDFHWKLIRLAFMSISDLVIIPAQDLTGYGAKFRMNRPGTAMGNWGWKLTPGALNSAITGRLKRFGKIFSRVAEKTD